MTTAQVAYFYNVEQSTIRNWVASGRLTVHTKDARGRNLFHADELPREYLAVRA
jgi:DNA-binding transcriptional MerR regulator